MKLPDFVRQGVSLTSYSTLGVGGPADYFAELNHILPVAPNCPFFSDELLIKICGFAHERNLDIFTLGRGSNVLFGDYGFRGLVLHMRTDKIRFVEGRWVDAGVLVSTLVNIGKSCGLTGFEHFAGLPGTVGGAIYGNAGCYGSEFWNVVEDVTFFDGEYIRNIKKEPKLFKYRWSIFKEHPDWIILSARLSFKIKGKKQVAADTKRVLDKRLSSQPKLRSVGCIFKNTDSYSAGQLIDACGLKGRRVGGAMISQEHANFFVNLGGASAGDFLELIKIAKSEVFARYHIDLEEEIIRVGEF